MRNDMATLNDLNVAYLVIKKVIFSYLAKVVNKKRETSM